MSENDKPPFEQAKENAQIFVERADMMQSLSNLNKIIIEAKTMTATERESVDMIVEATLKTLSKYLVERGYEWN